MSGNNYFDKEPMIEMYILETNQLLEQLENITLNIEKSHSMGREEIDEIFRIMHTLKGSAAMMLYEEISFFTHAVEDLFFVFREEPSRVVDYTKICDIVLNVADFVKAEVLKIEKGLAADGFDHELKEKIQKYLEQLKSSGLKSVKKEKPLEKQRYYISSHQVPKEDNSNKYKIHIRFEEDSQMENIRAFSIVHTMKEQCKEIVHIPRDLIDAASAGIIIANGFWLYIATEVEQKEVYKWMDDAVFIKSYEVQQIDKIPTIEEQAAKEELAVDLEHKSEPQLQSLKEKEPLVLSDEQDIMGDGSGEYKESVAVKEEKDVKESAAEGTKPSTQSVITVNINKLDKLMDLVGEIVISESMVTRNPDLEGLMLENFNKASRQLRKLTDELQDIVMSIRMVPVAPMFQKMRRIVRDMGKKLGKEVELVLIGEDTEIDKTIIDQLSDPLMHLVRNAMDHGIEEKEERFETDKRRTAQIVMEARNTGGDVVITISDDGRGLNREQIINKARERGLMTKTDLEINDREAFNLIMHPGFSTKETVTEFSGRGVGMDVVKKNIEKVGGAIGIESEWGRGTTVSIKIPLTLAIIDGMEIKVGPSLFTIPTASIKESFRAETEELVIDPNGNEMVMIRGACYPLLRLGDFFSIGGAVKNHREGIVVVVENDQETFCLFADKLLGEQQVVVKPLPLYVSKYYGEIQGVGGCTILGNGDISLILDVNSM